MSIKKQNLKNKGVCKVTFSFNEQASNVEKVRIPGDFNNWDVNCEPMKKLKTGRFSQTINFETGKTYQFKYLINDSVWENDPEADYYVHNGLDNGDSNSVIVV
jgi:1,4-alpha-glucan branching enzyme